MLNYYTHDIGYWKEYKEKIRNGGRFPITTKQKIKTEVGTILKVVIYDPDNKNPIEEYRIKPICHVCGGSVDCRCYNEDNTDATNDNLLDHVTNELKKDWVCEKNSCIVSVIKKDPEYYNELIQKCGSDLDVDIVNYLIENSTDCDEDNGSFCNN